MKLDYTIWDPTKNITLLVSTPVSREEQPVVAAKLMAARPQVEQVGFLEAASLPGAVLRLQMMGGEFCGNASMDDLKQGIRLRAYANTDPVIAYKQESLTMFEEMISAIQKETARRMFSVRIKTNEEVKRERVAKDMTENVGGDDTAPKKQPRKVNKIGRNDPCPCGSGKKFKNCTCAEYHSN